MGSAFGFMLVVIALGIFMPDVLRALSVFLLALFQKATVFLEEMPLPVAPADMGQPVH